MFPWAWAHFGTVAKSTFGNAKIDRLVRAFMNDVLSSTVHDRGGLRKPHNTSARRQKAKSPLKIT
jgi:hypothetical protein